MRFCYMCSDGVADAERAAEVVAGFAAGERAAKRILEDLTDSRAFDVVARAAADGSLDVRRSALIALGGIADRRGIAIASAALEDDDDGLRHEAIDTLAELGADGADAIAGRLADPRDRARAARALAWLGDPRAFEALALMLDSDEVIGDNMSGGATILAMARLGGREAVAVLSGLADRVIAAADAESAPDWQVRGAASSLAQSLVDMRNPDAQAVADALLHRFDGLWILPPGGVEPYRAPVHPRRTVPRQSFTLEAVDRPVTEPVTKFGGQPVWIGPPAWPLAFDGGPATFMAQFTIPGRDGLAYLFLNPNAFEPSEEDGFLFVRPGPGPERQVARATGPTFWTEIHDQRTRYRSMMTLRRVESLAILEPGFDVDDWAVINDDPETSRDDDRDWMKVGGNPRWLQGDEMPDEPGWRFLFQFTAFKVGRELGDGAEVYGLIHDDGRGRVIIHSH